MKIQYVRAIEGINFFSFRPVIRGVIDISNWQGQTTRELGDFNERLVSALPTLASHTCSRGKPGGFMERLEEGTLPGHVLEHVAIELLALAGENARYGKTRLLDENKQEYEVVYEYECREAGLEAFFLAVDILNKLHRGCSVSELNISSATAKLRELRLKNMPGPSCRAILEACSKRGIPVQKLGTSLYQLGYGRFQRRFQAAMTDNTPCIGVDIAGDKQLTRKVLAGAGIPVPAGKIAETEEEIISIFRKWRQPVVVKPCRGNQGKGVSLDLRNEKEVSAAFRLAEVYDPQVIIEEYVRGNNYRLLVINEKLAAAARKIPPTVIGDGRSNIKQLIAKENDNPLRGFGHDNYLSKITLDSIVVMNLKRQGLSLLSVPAAGERIILRQSANLSTGSTAEDVTDIVHPDNAELAVYAAKVLGLDIAGVDMILDDISKPFHEQNGKIIEINASPGLRMHLLPSRGKHRDIGSEIAKLLFPKGNGRIPIISVTGTNGKTTTVRLISKMLQKQNLTVGMTSSEGIYINDKILLAGDLSGPSSAQVILRHKDVQVAVLETARGGILRAGLGYDYADVAVITNISEDHLGQYGIDDIEDLTKVKSLVAEAVKRHSYVILNADNKHTVDIASKTRGQIIFFSTNFQNRTVCKHIALGGTAVVTNHGKVFILCGGESVFVCHLSKIPLTWGGKALHNVENVLAAVAACWSLGYNAAQIRKSIIGFGKSCLDNKGRLESYEINGVKVVLDYGHNPAGIHEVLKTLKQIKHRQIIGCIGLPGDRSNSTVKNLAREAAAGFDFLYIKEDQDLRGREPGEIAGIIADEARKAGFNPKKIKIILKETEAFTEALAKARQGDIVVVFYEKAEPLRQILAAHHCLPGENAL